MRIGLTNFSCFALFIIASAIYCLPAQGQALSSSESDYYQNNIGPTRRTFTLRGANSLQDSNRLNQVIQDVSDSGGGIITIGARAPRRIGYLRDVNMQDGVQLRFRSNVRLRPFAGGTNPPRNVLMINLGRTGRVRDVAVTNVNEDSTNRSTWFTVELNGGASSRQRFISINRASNFKVSGFRVRDSNTVFANVELNPTRDINHSRLDGDIPTDGLVKDIVSRSNHAGYGIVQARAGRRVLFRNLDGEGGITLRLESGIQDIRSADATIEDLVGRNLTVRNGQTAVLISPHRQNQGRVDVRGITALSSAFAVTVSGGFLDRNTSLAVNNVGSFDSRSVVTNIRRVVGGDNAQLRLPSIRFFPCRIQNTIQRRSMNPDGISFPGRSVATVRGGANYDIRLTLPPNGAVSGRIQFGNVEVDRAEQPTCP